MERVMSTKNKSWWLGLTMVVLCLTGMVAQADPGGGNGNGNGNGKGDNPPAAPEPAVFAMLGVGVVMVGGYIVYRLRRRGVKTER